MPSTKAVADYGKLIDNIQQIDASTKKHEKRTVLIELATFLKEEGYTQLAVALKEKARALTHEHN